MTEHLRVSPDVLQRLGEELNPHPDQSIVELVRNAFDADASECTVSLTDTGSAGGFVVVEDDGDGMSREAITQGWLILGRSVKSAPRATRLHRLPVGDKGLGRLAALRLGQTAVVTTKPRGSAYEHRVEFDWNKFDEAAVIEEVPIEVVSSSSNRGTGTRIEIGPLRRRLTRRDVKRLARSMVLLADPFETESGFRPVLVAPDFTDLEHLVRQGYFDMASYYVRADLDSDGQASLLLSDTTIDHEWRASHAAIAKGRDGRAYETPAASFELWAFTLAGSQGSRTATLGGIREWLSVVGGVHIYYRGLRVHPYGDEGHDWLDMNLRRVRSPEARPSTNTAVGRVVLADEQTMLTQKTDRTGFIEDEPFVELRSFCVDVLEWVARTRLSALEARRRETKRSVEAQVEKATKDLRQRVEAPSPPRPAEIERAVQRVEQAVAAERSALRHEIEMYQALSTVGAATSVFGHEAFKTIGRLRRAARAIESEGLAALGEARFSETLSSPLAVLRRAVDRLDAFARLPIGFLIKSKREETAVDVAEAIRNVIDLLAPFIEGARVAVDPVLPEEVINVRGTPVAIEVIITNLILNAVTALQRGPSRARLLTIEVSEASGRALIVVSDNGPGLRGIAPNDIWLPGETTTPGGTGIGLTIVRDAAASLGGTVAVHSPGSLGGADFVLDLPIAP